METIKTKENTVELSLSKNDNIEDIKKVLDYISYEKYNGVCFITNDVHTSVIHKLRDLFVERDYLDTGNPLDNSKLIFMKN